MEERGCCNIRDDGQMCRFADFAVDKFRLRRGSFTRSHVNRKYLDDANLCEQFVGLDIFYVYIFYFYPHYC